MIYTVSCDRLYLPFDGKEGNGKRKYDIRIIDKADLFKIQGCMLHAVGLTNLTDYLYMTRIHTVPALLRHRAEVHSGGRQAQEIAIQLGVFETPP